MTIRALPLETFLAELGSKAATPGGGSAAAVLGALGAALCGMVANLTAGKKKYAAVEDRMQRLIAQADALRQQLVDAIEADVVAFEGVMRAYAMPKQTEAEIAAREAAIQHGLLQAIDAPLLCARLCRQAMVLAEEAAAHGNTAVISDAGVAMLAADAGLRSSALNVMVNVKSLSDRSAAAPKRAELDALMCGSAELAARVYQDVWKHLAEDRAAG
jgi:formiminotetrahydrofolate cyclodeaminase